MSDATGDSESLDVAMGLELPICRSMLKNSPRRFKFSALLKSTKNRERVIHQSPVHQPLSRGFTNQPMTLVRAFSMGGRSGVTRNRAIRSCQSFSQVL